MAETSGEREWRLRLQREQYQARHNAQTAQEGERMQKQHRMEDTSWSGNTEL